MCRQPNCYSRIIATDTDKKIVIFANRRIENGEEIKYDYKFPLEEDKIPCNCGAPSCSGYMN